MMSRARRILIKTTKANPVNDINKIGHNHLFGTDLCFLFEQKRLVSISQRAAENNTVLSIFLNSLVQIFKFHMRKRQCHM